MANPEQIILGKRRGAWVMDAAQAMIAATTPSARWFLLRDGYHHFERVAGPLFRELAGFSFDSVELRYMWGNLRSWVNRKEKHLHAGFEDQYQRERTHSTPEASTRPEWQGEGDGITVDTLPDHEKRRMD